MCKYCEGSNKPLNRFHKRTSEESWLTKSIRLTKDNNISMYVENSRFNGYNYEDDDITEGLSACYTIEHFKLSAKIKYCPMCGRKLD